MHDINAMLQDIVKTPLPDSEKTVHERLFEKLLELKASDANAEGIKITAPCGCCSVTLLFTSFSGKPITFESVADMPKGVANYCLVNLPTTEEFKKRMGSE